jgi:hypothetical protein
MPMERERAWAIPKRAKGRRATEPPAAAQIRETEPSTPERREGGEGGREGWRRGRNV